MKLLTNWRTYVVYMLVYLTITIFLVSCYSQRKAEAQVDHIGRTYPKVLASKCETTYPPKVTGTDTIRKTDSIPFFVECPQNEADLAEFAAEDYAGPQTAGTAVINLSKPSGNKKPAAGSTADTSRGKIKGVFIKIPVTSTTVTNTSEDPAKIVILQEDKKTLTQHNTILKKWLTIAFTLAGSFFLICVLLGYLYYRLLKSKKP